MALILGSSGSGKSLFSRKLENELLNLDNSALIPVYIPLASFQGEYNIDNILESRRIPKENRKIFR